jgi:hypothetical protein
MDAKSKRPREHCVKVGRDVPPGKKPQPREKGSPKRDLVDRLRNGSVACAGVRGVVCGRQGVVCGRKLECAQSDKATLRVTVDIRIGERPEEASFECSPTVFPCPRTLRSAFSRVPLLRRPSSVVCLKAPLLPRSLHGLKPHPMLLETQ